MAEIFDRWRQGLSRTRKTTFGRIATFLGATEITEETWEDLEALLIQADRFGTSIAQALRVYSKSFRTARYQRAEEIAAKMGTKLIFPLAFCMFPAFFVVGVGFSQD